MSNISNIINYQVDNKIYPFLWLHHESKKKLKNTVDAIFNSGVNGFCIESRPHPDFLGKTWWEDLDYILNLAQQKDMKVWILDDSHFPTGYVDGRVPQSLQKKFLYIKQLDFAGPMTNAKILLKYVNPVSFSVKKKKTDQILKVLMAQKTADNQIDSRTILDVTNKLNQDILKINLPKGQWRIFVLVQTYDGGEEETEHYLNPIVKEATNFLVDTVYDAHYQHYKNLFGKTILGFFSDEPRFGNIHGALNQIGQTDMVLPWRDNMLNDFFKEDYQLLPLLSQTTDVHHAELKIRYKYMNLVSKLYAKNFSKVLETWCKKHGVNHIGHLLEDNGTHARLGYGPGHYFRAMSGYDMAGIDVVLNQIMPGLDTGFYKSMTKSGWNGEFFHYGLADLANSNAQLDASKNKQSMVELFGAYGWAEGLPLMKYLADHMMVRGINHFVPHAFNSYHFPDPDCPPHFYADGHEPELKFYPILFKYMNRINAILEDSMEVCHVAVLYHAENEWLDSSAMPFEKITKQLYQHQIPHELVPIDYLKECDINDGNFTINNHSFKYLLIPQTKYITAELFAITKRLIKKGINILFINKLPEYDENYNEIEYHSTNVRVVQLNQLTRYLNHVTDIELAEPNKNLRLYRFKNNKYNGAFLFNENTDQDLTVQINLKQKHDIYLFDPMTLKITFLGKQMIRFPLTLKSSHTCFILFDLKIRSKTLVPLKKLAEKEIDHWDLEIENKKITNFHLGDINELPGLENYAGKIIYTSVINLKSLSAKIMINLGQLGEIAQLGINNKTVGKTIEQNQSFDVTSFLKLGQNKITVEVINNLAIKIQDPETQFSALGPAGLLGPVKLKFFNN